MRGPALLTFCRLRASERGLPVLSWRPFPLASFWAWLGGQLPAASFAAAARLPLLGRLPHAYRSAESQAESAPELGRVGHLLQS